MKKLFSLLTLALLTMSAWAAETYTYTFESTQFSANETKTLNSIDWTLEGDGGFWGYDATKGQQFGSSSKPYKNLTLSTNGITGTITKVTVNASTGSQAVATMDVTVGETSFITQQALSSTATDYTGTGSATGDVVIAITQTTSKAIYIKSITIEYEGAPIAVAAPVFNPNGGKFSVNSLEVTISCPDGPCDIFYSEGTELDWTNYTYYSGPFYVTETKTFTAVASKSNVMSDPTTVTFTKIDPAPEGVFLPEYYDAVNQKPFTITNGDVTFNCTNGYINDTQFRFYKNSTLTFTSAGKDIVKIEFTSIANGNEEYGPGNMTSETGYAVNDNIGTWTGKASEVVFNVNAQVRASQIVFTLDDGTTAYVQAPTLPEECEFEDEMTVTITNNEEGATVKYALNDGAYETYEDPFTITETTTVKAYAEYEGIQSNVVTATYTKKEVVDDGVLDLDEANHLPDGTAFTFKGKAVVTYHKGDYLFLRDASGYGLIYKYSGNTFDNGVVLNQNWTATKTTYNDLIEYTGASDVSASDETNAELAAVQVITADQMADMINAYVQIDNVKSISGTTATLTDGTTIALYNRFGIAIPEFDNADASITGIVSIFKGNLQLYFISADGIVAAPVITPASCDFENSLEVTITCATEGAAIKYSTDEQTTWNDYTEPFTVTETTTVYAKAVKDGKDSKIVSATYTMADPSAKVTYTLVTDVAELADGDKIIFVGYHENDAFAMAEHLTYNFNGVGVEVVDNAVTTGLANVVTLEANENGFWNFKTDDGYLYADGSDTKGSNNYLKLEDEVDANGYADASITNADDITIIEFQGGNDSRFMRFNYNNGNPRFSCYKESSSIKAPVYIFKAKAEVVGKPGDVNNDGQVTILDVTVLIDHLLSGDFSAAEDFNPTNADIDGGGISISDVTALIDILLGM